jgi:hypothetical protein
MHTSEHLFRDVCAGGPEGVIADVHLERRDGRNPSPGLPAVAAVLALWRRRRPLSRRESHRLHQSHLREPNLHRWPEDAGDRQKANGATGEKVTSRGVRRPISTPC